SWMILRTFNPATSARDIYARRTDGDSTTIAIATTPADEYGPVLSPDGRWIAYVSTESGREEVYVRPFPNSAEGKYQISINGGSEPQWAHSGRELFYINGLNQLTAATVATSPSFAVTRQQALFEVTLFSRDQTHHHYAVGPGDQRFLMVQLGRFGSGDLVLVQNWTEQLKARLRR
ncbi:MAG: hypothetical protein K6U89_17525, partial [Chloroflexi bacterium]|nr:hypothetical protein [Chloroflexota bacterium]